MNLFILLAVISVVLLGLLARAYISSRPWGATPLANDGALTAGRHKGGLLTGYHDSAPVTTRYLLVTQGNADNHFKLPASVLDIPLGVCTDEPAATTDPVNIATLLGAAETRLMVAAGAISAGQPVVTNGDGKVKSMAALGAGIYWCVGFAVTSSVNSGDQLEVQPTLFPIGVDVIT